MASDVPGPAGAAAPAAAGPAGPWLEIQIGAAALVALLTEDPPRGFPGMSIRAVSFQRAAMGSPLDDVIVEGTLADGGPAKLEMQVKRTLEFTAGDAAWRDVVGQIAASAGQAGVEPPGLQRAVAIARTSTQIERAYQQVLAWARGHEDAAAFFRRLAIPRMATDGMRTFVRVFRENLRVAGFANDDDTVWRLLRRLQLLAFDLEAPGSAVLAALRQQLAGALAPAERHRAGDLWNALTAIAAQADTSGGGLTRAELVRRLHEDHGLAVGAPPSLLQARDRLRELAEGVLSDIDDRVRGSRLLRPAPIAQVDQAFQTARVVEIRGAGGVGKSAVAKAIAQRARAEGEVICLNEIRTPAPGWLSLQSMLACPVSKEALLAALSASGGALLFVDGIDRFLEAPQRATVRDLLGAAVKTPGLRVLVTARNDFDGEAREWFDAACAGASLARVEVLALDDEDAAALALESTGLAFLLQPGHPAAFLTRNLFQLSRLMAEADRAGAAPDSEAALAQLWWRRGGGLDEREAAGRLVLLRRAVVDSFAGRADISLEAVDAGVVRDLVEAQTLVEVTPRLTARFQHDVLRDWAVAGLLDEQAEQVDALPLDRPMSVLYARGVELAARMALENGDLVGWRRLLDRLAQPGVHPTWRRVALLALTRSEKVADLLPIAAPLLLDDNGRLLLELMRLMRAVDSRPLAEVFAVAGQPLPEGGETVLAPRGSGWFVLVDWAIAREFDLPAAAVAELVELFTPILVLFGTGSALARPLIEFTFRWLWRLEGRDEAGRRDRWSRDDGPTLTQLRILFLACCEATPDLAERYLVARTQHPRGSGPDHTLLGFWGTAPRAAPRAYADYLLAALTGGEAEDDDEPGFERRRRRRRGVMLSAFSVSDGDWSPVSPARGGLLDLLLAAPAEGLRVVQGLVDHLLRDAGPDPRSFVIAWPDGDQRFVHRGGYLDSRGASAAYVFGSVMMALEAWGHVRIEAGDPVETVVRDVLGAGDQPAARLAVAVDLVLSHWEAAIGMSAPLLGSPDVLALDSERYLHETLGMFNLFGTFGTEPRGRVSAAELRARPSRGRALEGQFYSVLQQGPAFVEDVRRRLQAHAEAVRGLEPPDGYAQHPVHRAFDLALALLDEANWRPVRLQMPDGRIEPRMQFQEPVAMAEDLAPQRAEAERRGQVSANQGVLRFAFTRERAVEPDRRAEAIAWARAEAVPTAAKEDDFEARQTQLAVLMAAAVILRDLDPDPEATAWARATLRGALDWPSDEIFGAMNGQAANSPAAIAAVGLIGDLLRRRDGADLDVVLGLALRPDRAVVGGFETAMPELAAYDPALPGILLGLGLAASVYSWRTEAEMNRDASETRTQAHRAAALEAARAWRAGGPAPPLPTLPVDGRLRPRRRRRRPPEAVEAQRARGTPGWAVVEQIAAAWLSAACYPGAPGTDALLGHVWPYTRFASGGDATEEDDEDLLDGAADAPAHWNAAYFNILAGQIAPRTPDAALAAVQPILGLPDGAVITFMESFLMTWDRLWVVGPAPSEATFLAVRAAFAERFARARRFEWVRYKRERSLEVTLAGGVCALAAHLRLPVQPRFVAGEPRLAAMIPSLASLGLSVPQSGYIAELTLSLLKDLHDPALAPAVAQLAQAWLAVGEDTAFWSTWGVGARLVDWVLGVASVPGGPEALRAEAAAFAQVLDVAVRFGVPHAARAEALVLPPEGAA